jgi:parallel beta-helix repeat protein
MFSRSGMTMLGKRQSKPASARSALTPVKVHALAGARRIRTLRGLIVAATLVAAALATPSASAAPAAVSGCQTLGVPGAYALATDIAVVESSCIEITASDVKLDLAGHTISCTGLGFAESCQVPASVASQGIRVAPNLTGVVVAGPGTISGFDTGVAIQDSNASVRGITAKGPACDPASCSRPFSTGIIVLGRSGVNLRDNDMSNHAVGLRVDSTQCPDGDAACVLNANAVHDNNCQGILLVASSGYTLTQNVARSNGAAPCAPRGGITLVFGSNGNTVVNNDSSHNNGFGIRTGFGNGIGPQTSGNRILNNVAKGNALADLSQVDGANSWNDNNRCITEDGTVPHSVCDPSE